MIENFDFHIITEPLLVWFQENARVLPWREEPTPYHVWVSEIMLQQTRVEAVKPYFKRFMESLPDVYALADCEEERLLKLWEGLGYYNRVRNMREAAREIVCKYNGELPDDYEKLLSLKGIGSYTAGAIASIAYGKPVPAVDGNVLRIITRVSADTSDIAKASVKTKIEKKLQEIIPKDKAGKFNQALMELGAVVCVPNGEPHCGNCAWKDFCQAKLQGKISEIPVKTKAKARKIEEKTVFIIRRENRIILNKRDKKGLLAGLYEFPNVSGKLNEEEALLWIKRQALKPLRIERAGEAKHIFSHVEWHMTGYVVWIDELSKQGEMLYVDIQQTREKYPIPAAFEKYKKYIFCGKE